MPMTTEEVEREFNKLRMASANLPDGGENDNESCRDNTQNKGQDEADAPSASEKDEVRDGSISATEAHALKEEGNTLYRQGSYEEALKKYQKAVTSLHAPDDQRAVYLANAAAASLKLQQFEDVVRDTTHALRLRPGYAKAVARRREAREKMEDWRGALTDAEAIGGLSAGERGRLTALAEKKEKVQRDEAMESLKGIGNSILSGFGMSLDDFAVEKDPNTGSYSVKMK